MEKFGNRIDYSKTEFIDSRTKSTFICKEHGEFQTLPYRFLQNKYGCPKCNDKLKYTTESFIEECKKNHKYEYDYSKVVYTGITDYITIICPKHGEYRVLASSFLQGSECQECVYDSYRLTTEEFIKRAREIHGDYYNYDKVNYINSNTKITITCPKHGDFETLPTNHLKGCRCKKCALEDTKLTKGELLICDILNKYHIPYNIQRELTVKELARNSSIIRLDFVVKYNNKIFFIEYNGKQHYTYIPFFHNTIEEFEKQQRRDNVLREFCDLHKDKVTLLEIPYTMKENDIENLILTTIEYT